MVPKDLDLKCELFLSKLTGKKNIIFMDKCRQAAELIMRYSFSNDMNKLIIQEEGGWHTYEKSALKLGFKVFKAHMNKGVIDKKTFSFINNSLIIINSNPGYAFVESFDFISGLKDEKVLLVNDVSGSVGDVNSKIGDVIIGSFGDDKPLSAGGGGFIAVDDSLFFEFKNIKEKFYSGAGKNIVFQDLFFVLNNFVKTKKEMG